MKLIPMTAIVTSLLVAPLVSAEVVQVSSFADSEDYMFTTDGNATQKIVTSNATKGDKAWQVNLGQSWQGSANIYNENLGAGWNWENKTRLIFDVTNKSNKDVNFGVKVLTNFTWQPNDVFFDYRNAKPGTHTIEINLDSTRNGEMGKGYNKGKVNTLKFFAAQTNNAELFIDNIRVAD
ncbi:hypothetical protein [Vibrio sp. WXL103]|uniref:hypothetical protein n=1 Tax=Vibrio sp. WXL103 TaxID=3450710 RepID=UPI003EC4B4CA